MADREKTSTNIMVEGAMDIVVQFFFSGKKKKKKKSHELFHSAEVCWETRKCITSTREGRSVTVIEEGLGGQHTVRCTPHVRVSISERCVKHAKGNKGHEAS